jgi:hypothetical protein
MISLLRRVTTKQRRRNGDATSGSPDGTLADFVSVAKDSEEASQEGCSAYKRQSARQDPMKHHITECLRNGRPGEQQNSQSGGP